MKFIKLENVEEKNTRMRSSFLRRISKRKGRVTSIQIPLKQNGWHRLSVKNSWEFKEDGKGGLQVWPSGSLHDRENNLHGIGLFIRLLRRTKKKKNPKYEATTWIKAGSGKS